MSVLFPISLLSCELFVMCNCKYKGEDAGIQDRRVFIRSALLAPVSLAFFSLSGASSRAGEPFVEVPMPSARDACPVCGMFPLRYPDWIATVLYSDGHADHFDGAKDMFKYLLDMKKYASGRKVEDISAIVVTDYYATARIDARKALYVIGSDVLGPMGHELIPHPDHFDADEFMKDHKGISLHSFEEISMEMLVGLDNGEFHLQ